MSFEKTNPAWEFRLWQQRTGEWIEGIISKWQPPTIDTPDPKTNPIALPVVNWELIFWLISIGLVAWIIWTLYPIVLQYWTRRSNFPRRTVSQPAIPVKTQSEWLQVAQDAQRRGDYTQACRALYFAMLKRLQDQKILSADPSLTNGDYRQQLNQTLKSRSKRQGYRTLIQAHDRISYNAEIYNSDQYAECDRAFRDIERDMD